MSQLPRDGVRLVLEDERQFVSGLKRVNAIWDETVNRFRTAEGTFARLDPRFKAVDSGATGLTSSLGGLSAGALALGTAAGMAAVQIGQTFVNAVKNATNAVVGFITQGMHLAGLFQEMEFSALATGRTMGMTEEEIRSSIDTIHDLNIRYDVAAKSVAQMARNQIDMAKSTDLVRIAQGAGVLTQQDSSETLERLIWAATTHNTMMLRRMGIMTDLTDAEERFGQAMGKTREQLTEAELVQADVNAIIKAGSSLLDVYDAAMESPTKRLRSLTGRVIPEFQAALGAPFLDAWSTVIKSVYDFVSALGDALSEGGSLYPMMINLGAAASIMADGFAAALNWLTKLITGVADDAAVTIGDTIEQALRWGVELVAAFAEGIVEATTTVLVQAMNAISNMLTSWLLGASPPKVAPGIVQWGISLMEQYLEGMTEADFGILKAVQGPLKKVLEGPAFANISKALAGALAGGDRGTFLSTVERAAGVFGKSLRELADLNFQVADSVDAVRYAEEALEKARKKVTDSQAEVNKQTAEYNRLLREGASRDVLDAQLEQINAAEANMRAAMDQVNIEEDALDTAKARQEQLEDEAKLQKEVVDQLLGVNDALSEQDKKQAKLAAAKGAKGLRPLGAEITPSAFAITSSITEAIEKAKAALKEKFKDIFKPLGEAWESINYNIKVKLAEAWDHFKETVGKAWDALKVKYPILQDVEDWVTNLPEKLRTVRDWFSDKIPQAVEWLTGVLWENENSLYNRWLKLWTWLSETFWPWIRDTLWPKLQEFTEDIVGPLAAGFFGVAEEMQKVIDKAVELGGMSSIWTQIAKDVAFMTHHSPSPLEKGLKGVNQQLQVLATTRLPALANMGSQMRGAMAPMQMLSPVSNTNVTMNLGGNTFYGGMDQATFDARVEQSLRRTLRR